ncbi:MAG: TetR/AcrR family transcriptional regulator [Planctomycetota bacterium]
MGRPDLSETRRNEILDALERCVAREGLAGASLDRIAEEAGVKRQIIRHYLGNRDDVMRAFGHRLVARMHGDVEVMIAALPSEGRVGALLDMLFSTGSNSADSAASILLFEALIAAADREPELRDLVVGYVKSLTDAVASELATAHPGRERQEVWSTAYAVVALCFNHASMRPLNLPRRYGQSERDAARRLINTLDG